MKRLISICVVLVLLASCKKDNVTNYSYNQIDQTINLSYLPKKVLVLGNPARICGDSIVYTFDYDNLGRLINYKKLVYIYGYYTILDQSRLNHFTYSNSTIFPSSYLDSCLVQNSHSDFSCQLIYNNNKTVITDTCIKSSSWSGWKPSTTSYNFIGNNNRTITYNSVSIYLTFSQDNLTIQNIKETGNGYDSTKIQYSAIDNPFHNIKALDMLHRNNYTVPLFPDSKNLPTTILMTSQDSSYKPYAFTYQYFFDTNNKLSKYIFTDTSTNNIITNYLSY